MAENNAGAGAAAPIKWKLNPFQGNFNPGTTNGQKMFIERSKGHAEGKRFDLSKEHATDLHQFFISKESAYGGCCIIPIAFNGANRPTETANLITQHSKIPLDLVQRAAHKQFATTLGRNAPIPATPFTCSDIDPSSNDPDKETFFHCVHSSVLAKSIKNILSPLGFQDLLLQKDMFSFRDSTTGEVHYDGPTMLKIILSQIEPDTIVGMDSMKAQLESMKLHEFGNDVAKMLTRMQNIYNTLKMNGHAPDSFRRYVYTALKTGPNADFNNFMDRIIDDIQSGIGFNKDITTDKLIIAACTKYTNMVEDKSWGRVDPRDAKILALTTKLEKLEKNGASKLKAAANVTDGSNSAGGGRKSNLSIMTPGRRTKRTALDSTAPLILLAMMHPRNQQ